VRKLFPLLLLALACPLHAADTLLEVNVWVELEPSAGFDGEWPLSVETANRLMLEEARWVLGGMIYGFRFRYIPSDRARRVGEEFDLEPIAEVPWGDPHLSVLYTQRRGERAWAKVAYALESFQEARRMSWSTNSIPASTGRGERSILEGSEGKLGSIEEAVKSAIRARARTEIPNKPREIQGDVLIWEAPRTTINAGNYVTTVEIKLLTAEVTPYRIF
jgi:hypothetical protein